MTPHSEGIAERELLEAVPQPHVLLESVRDATGTIVDFVFAAANGAACQFNRLPREELLGRSLLSLHPNVVTSGLFEKCVAVVERGEAVELRDWAYPADAPDGEVRYFDVLITAVQGGVGQTWTDVTERHRVIDRLAESERRFRVLAENASDVVFLSDNDGLLVWISPNTPDLIGWPISALLGRSISDFLHPDDLSNLQDARQRLAEGLPAKMRMRVRKAAGDYHWMAVTVKPVFDDNGVMIGRAGSWTDIEDLMQAQEETDRNRARLRATLDAQIDPFIVIMPVRDEHGEIVDFEYVEANEAAVQYNQTTYEQLIGARMTQVFPGFVQYPPFLDYTRDPAATQPLILDEFTYSNEVLDADRTYDIRVVKFGEAVALTWRDVTERARAVMELEESEWRYRLLAENASDVIWVLDPDGRIDWASESTPAVLGWSVSQVVGSDALGYVHPDDAQRVALARDGLVSGGPARGTLRLRLADGQYRWFSASAQGDDVDGGFWRIVALRDVDAEVTARAELSGRIGRDPLTGLITRDRLERRLAEEVQRGTPMEVAVLSVGIDSLSRVNDAYTHAAGDVVLATMAERLLEATEGAAVVARATGAEFLVLLDAARFGDATAVAERILAAAREPITVGDHSLSMTVSIGVSGGHDGQTPAELVRAATLAMRAAKEAGRDRIAFSSQRLAASAQQWLALTEQATQALHDEHFVSWFQPIHGLGDGSLCGYEVLARWVKPTGEVVNPADFMPVAEASDLITHIDVAMMRQALQATAGLRDPLFVSLNVSARSLHAAGYEAALRRAVQETGIDPQRIHLEVTETNLLDVSDEVVARMVRIADLGIGWYIDDFGTGYSSISHLRDLPVSGIKLDVSFAAGIARGEVRVINLAQALVGLAQGLGLDTIAEGVEHEPQVMMLAAQGWRFGQGWLFGRPGPLG